LAGLQKVFHARTSHYIGLDTHDYGTWSGPIPEGSVFTVEPGIYILEEELGIRLEDDYVITRNGHVNLMGNIPIEAEEIEDLMNA
jgi:Xaa-Pro aminopeptidase